MGIVAIVPLASMAAANAALQAAGWSQPGWAPCFSVPAYGNGNPTHAACHAYGPAALITAIKAVSGVVFNEGTGDPAARLRTLLSGVAQWGDDAPALPISGNALANRLYRFGDELWWCIQTFNRTTFPAHPSTYPALIRRARRPGEVLPWVQPLDQWDAYYTVNKFTGQPDRVTDSGRLWRSTVADPTPNVWPPGTAGVWADEGPAV
jgi:hypothetical protein